MHLYYWLCVLRSTDFKNSRSSWWQRSGDQAVTISTEKGKMSCFRDQTDMRLESWHIYPNITPNKFALMVVRKIHSQALKQYWAIGLKSQDDEVQEDLGLQSPGRECIYTRSGSAIIRGQRNGMNLTA